MDYTAPETAQPKSVGVDSSQIDPSRVLCPSGRAVKGALLIGVVGANGTVGIASSGLRVDESFIGTAQVVGPPEKRFRFANRCLQGGCKQWEGGRCGVIEDSIRLARNGGLSLPLVDCAIRPACRWFRQAGDQACRVCPFVVTDVLQPTEVYPSVPQSLEASLAV